MHRNIAWVQESKILSTQVQLAPSTVQLWHKKLYDGSTAVALVNFGVFDGQHYNASFTSDMVCHVYARASKNTLRMALRTECSIHDASGWDGAPDGIQSTGPIC